MTPTTAGLALWEAANAPVLARREAREKAASTAQRDRDRLLETLRNHSPMTADEAGARVGLTPLSARPRMSELYKAGLVRPVGRGRSANGNPATMWGVV